MDTRSKALTICGRTVTVRPFRFFDLEKISQIQGDASQVYVLFALALRMEPDVFRQEFAEMDVLEAAELDSAIQEINADFFKKMAAKTSVQ